MTRTNISLPIELKEKAKRNGKHRGIKALSTYIQYLIEADDHLIQDGKIGLVSQGRPRINRDLWIASIGRPLQKWRGLFLRRGCKCVVRVYICELNHTKHETN